MRCENAIIISMRYFSAKTARARRSDFRAGMAWVYGVAGGGGDGAGLAPGLVGLV